MPTEAPPTPREAGQPPEPTLEPTGDVRRSRVYLLSRGPWSTLVRRSLSIATLAFLDVAGLAIGVYVALVLRALVYGDTIYWSLLWDTGPEEWLPFLAPITVLVAVALPLARTPVVTGCFRHRPSTLRQKSRPASRAASASALTRP